MSKTASLAEPHVTEPTIAKIRNFWSEDGTIETSAAV